MKSKTIIWLCAFFILLVIVLVTANFNTPVAASQDPGTGSLVLQSTPTLSPEALSEIGSTDGILAMGVVIALIVMIPLMVRGRRN